MNDGHATRALIVEDDSSIRQLLRTHLELNGFCVDEADDGCLALARIRAAVYDLIILDVMLPGLDGITLCRAIRKDDRNRVTPVVMVTARAGEADVVIGLESGADDYIAKPFGVRELMARVAAIMRRAPAPPAQPTSLSFGELMLDVDRRKTIVRGQDVTLTKQEFELLFQLASRPGVVFSRAALLEFVWKGDTFVTDRTVDSLVRRVRRKIERDPQEPQLLLTAWGIGYKLADAAYDPV